MALRMIILNLVADYIGVQWVVENPTSSVIHLLPFTDRYFSELFRYHTWLGAFGAETRKPIKIFTNCSRRTPAARCLASSLALLDALAPPPFAFPPHRSALPP